VSRKLIFCALLIFLEASRLPSNAQAPSSKEMPPASKPADSSSTKQETLETRVEQYLRNLYAWGPDFEVKVGPAKPSPVGDLLEVRVTVSMAGQSDTATMYVTKTGNFLLRGELADMAADPFADVRSKLHVGKSPAIGPADAKITLIEFADLECPSCRQLDYVLRGLLPEHPEIRLVFKHYPLTDIHPWAMTAAIATQCAYEQNPDTFWKMHDTIFDEQNVISPTGAWDKMLDLATKLGLQIDPYRACMTNPETAAQVKETMDEGHALNVTATPTTFVNARRAVGADKSLIERYIAYEKAIN